VGQVSRAKWGTLRWDSGAAPISAAGDYPSFAQPAIYMIYTTVLPRIYARDRPNFSPICVSYVRRKAR
jgi:hypothetical protein